MKEMLAAAMLCAVLAGMAVLWRAAGEEGPPPANAGGPQAHKEEGAWTRDRG